jgi:hypothetical protein
MVVRDEKWKPEPGDVVSCVVKGGRSDQATEGEG